MRGTESNAKTEKIERLMARFSFAGRLKLAQAGRAAAADAITILDRLMRHAFRSVSAMEVTTFHIIRSPDVGSGGKLWHVRVETWEPLTSVQPPPEGASQVSEGATQTEPQPFSVRHAYAQQGRDSIRSTR